MKDNLNWPLMHQAFNKQDLNKVISYKFTGRRAGDSFALVTSNQKAKEILSWQPTKTLSDILVDAQNELLANG